MDHKAQDFDDFHDEFDQIRQQHSDNLDHDQYGNDYDPNSEQFYDLDLYSIEFAKSLFFGLGNFAKYKGFNLVGHRCAGGSTEGCTQEEYEESVRLKDLLNKAYGDQPLGFFNDTAQPEPPSAKATEIEAQLRKLGNRCLNGPCEPCSADEYRAYMERFINSERDNPHDLYHRNNQTILDTSTMPDTPVDPHIFVAKVMGQLTTHNVLISDKMPDLLERMCRLFNFSIKPNKELPRTVKNLVFPAQTGIGKSVSVQVYVSLLEEISSIIVVPKVEEAIKYCSYINQLSGDNNYARCYYSLTDKNKDDPLRVEATKLRNYRCIVITHNMFRRVNAENTRTPKNQTNKEHDELATPFTLELDIVDYFGTFDGRPRDFVAIDEKLSFFEQFRLDYNELDRLISNVESALEESKELGEKKTSKNALQALKDFKEFLLFKDDKIVTNSESVVVKGNLDSTARSDLLATGEAISLSERSSFEQYPIKLTGLKNRDAAVEILHRNNLQTQTRKRNVIGISTMEVKRLVDFTDKDVEAFYCEKFNPPIANCLPNIEPESSMDNSELYKLFDDESFTGNLSDEQVEAYKDLEYARNEQTGLELVSSVLRVLLRIRVDELLTSLEALGANKNRTYRQNTLNAINKQLDALRYFSKNHFLIYKTNKTKALLATENLLNQLGLSIVLDATAQINEYYQLANRFLGHVGFVVAPQIRQYKNLTIHKARGFSQARSAIYKDKSNQEVQAIAKSYASYALNELSADDKMLIICHKDFVSALKKQVNDKRVVYTHWGNHVGSNSWSHCNKVMLIGWNHLPPIEHISAINASLESVSLTSRHLDDDLLESFAISQLADDIVQGLMRSQARIIDTKESDCKPTSFYLFYKDDNKSEKVLEAVESQFPQSTIINWKPNGASLPTKKTKRNKRADLVIEFLIEKSKDHETYLRVDVQTKLDINKSTMTRLMASDYMTEKLNEHGFVYKAKDSKSQQFILK
ncbi:hypothetical protein [Marinobacterium stanieri]|uniref:hypothetical protein n=1 Tax=Marinobacterium stanieri TaxID=49186 RepID=UPI003A94D703